ncbi:MAG TPA: hypothetical protein VMA34_02115 [Terracidiphilus sp.]|nr:hypothetical protein [Terracidiphilus sp.]
MTKVRPFLLTVLTGCLVLLTASVPTVRAQAAPAAAGRLPFDAVLVLSPEFCATTFKQGSMWTTGGETFNVGKMACAELEPALKPAYADLTVAAAPPASVNAHFVLIPSFASAHATTSAFAFSNREMDVFLEWTVKDPAGKTVWLQTVQGSSKHHMGNMFTHSHDVKLIVKDSVKDVAAQSAARMEAAPELRALSSQHASAAK